MWQCSWRTALSLNRSKHNRATIGPRLHDSCDVACSRHILFNLVDLQTFIISYVDQFVHFLKWLQIVLSQKGLRSL